MEMYITWTVSGVWNVAIYYRKGTNMCSKMDSCFVDLISTKNLVFFHIVQKVTEIYFIHFCLSLSYIHVAWGKHMYLMWKDKFEHTRGTNFTSPNFISTINVSLVRDIFHKIYAKLRKRWVATAFHIQLCHSC